MGDILLDMMCGYAGGIQQDLYFSYPLAVEVSNGKLYIADVGNLRLKVHSALDLSFITEKTSYNGYSLADPCGTDADGTYIFIADDHRIIKFSESDLSYIARFGSQGSGDDQFNAPNKLSHYSSHIFIADKGNSRIKKHLISDLSYVAKFGSEGSGDDQFDYPNDICCDNTYVYIADSRNDRIKKHLKSDLSYVAKFGSYGTGNDQFEQPFGICNDGTHLYICDCYNHRIKKHLASDLSFVAKIGEQGPP
jgi:DNA-binding beta-propeller fold protein YncE